MNYNDYRNKFIEYLKKDFGEEYENILQTSSVDEWIELVADFCTKLEKK
jgi:hypothetical protein